MKRSFRWCTYPRHSMYAIYAYIGVVLGVNVGIYGIHGESGYSCRAWVLRKWITDAVFQLLERTKVPPVGVPPVTGETCRLLGRSPCTHAGCPGTPVRHENPTAGLFVFFHSNPTAGRFVSPLCSTETARGSEVFFTDLVESGKGSKS